MCYVDFKVSSHSVQTSNAQEFPAKMYFPRVMLQKYNSLQPVCFDAAVASSSYESFFLEARS